MESEVQVLGSESIALAVIDDLKLTNDPEFIGTGNGPIVGTSYLRSSAWTKMRVLCPTFSANESQ